MSTKSIELKLYLLSLNYEPMPDELGSLVVAAPTESEARGIANQESKNEGYVWTDGQRTTCRLLGVADRDVDQGIIHPRPDDL